jgi:hypothetical protein
VEAAGSPNRDSDRRPRGGERGTPAERVAGGRRGGRTTLALAWAPALFISGLVAPVHCMPAIADLGELLLAYLELKRLEAGPPALFLRERAHVKVREGTELSTL